MEEELKRLIAEGFTVRRIKQELAAKGLEVDYTDEELIVWIRKLRS